MFLDLLRTNHFCRRKLLKKHKDNILFDKTISMFQDLNEIIVVFRNKDIQLNSYNKTVKLHTFKDKKANRKKTLKNKSNDAINNIKKI